MSGSAYNNLLDNLKIYKKKHFINLLLKGIIFSIGAILSTYIIVNFLEFVGNFEKIFRLTFLLLFIIVSIFSTLNWVIVPLFKLYNLDKNLSDEDASLQLGLFFPEVADKLLNTIQLNKLKASDNELVNASIHQKSENLSYYSFVKAVDYNSNKKYGRILFFIILLLLAISIFVPQLFTNSTSRIINYNTNYIIPAPFLFRVNNKFLKVFKNEDFKLQVSLIGKSLPDNIYITIDSKRSKLTKIDSENFSFTFRNVQKTENFTLEGAGFASNKFTLHIINKPVLLGLEATLEYPKYLNKSKEVISNLGNIEVPEGTKILWNIQTLNTSTLYISNNNNIETLNSADNHFNYKSDIKKNEIYKFKFENNQGKSDEEYIYTINVLKDQYPTITLESYTDTINFKSITLGGTISDDYGLKQLKLFYKLQDSTIKPTSFKSINLKFNSNLSVQNYIYNWFIDSLNISPNQKLLYFLEVWDNDQVNGSKSTRSPILELKMLSNAELKSQLAISSSQAEQSLTKMVSRAESINKELSDLGDKLKNKNNLNWQDKKQIEEMLKKQYELTQEIEQLKKDFKSDNAKRERLAAQDEELKEKAEQLQKLINELVNEDTKKLFEELQKLLNENNKLELDKNLDKIKANENNLTNELERSLEMFKQLKFDQKLDDNIKELEKLSLEEKQLSEETIDKNKDLEKIKEKQLGLNYKFDKVDKDLQELKNLNESLQNKEFLDLNLDKDKESIKNDQNNSIDKIEKKQNKKASDSQKNASDKMKKMQEKLAEMKNENSMNEMQENLDDLRSILENLITLSFEQENLMKDFRKVNQSDPRFIALSQKQVKLKEDSKIIEDSLLSLAKRVFQIESYVTREVTKMKQYMDESSEFLKLRRPEIATGKQQYAMTSINNLALLLNDALKQMQEQMANAMKSGDKSCKKPGNKPGDKPGLGEMQKQLNEKIEGLKKGGKTGREYSEELAKLSMQQEMIRNALKKASESNKKLGKNGNQSDMESLEKEMQKTENDLVNKKIDPATIGRQKDILTRLLEAEKTTKERELDNKREAKTSSNMPVEYPANLQKYLSQKSNQIELLKTISPQLNPYYKEQVNEYFHKIEN